MLFSHFLLLYAHTCCFPPFATFVRIYWLVLGMLFLCVCLVSSAKQNNWNYKTHVQKQIQHKQRTTLYITQSNKIDPSSPWTESLVMYNSSFLKKSSVYISIIISTMCFTLYHILFYSILVLLATVRNYTGKKTLKNNAKHFSLFFLFSSLSLFVW